MAKKRVKKPQRVQLTLRVPVEVRIRLQREAAKLGMTVNQYFLHLVEVRKAEGTKI